MITFQRPVLQLLLALGPTSIATVSIATGSIAFTTPLPAQSDPLERLRRDQDELFRKAERLQELMQRLFERYEREGRSEAKLLAEGLAHLEAAGLLREVAGIRDDLASTAFSEALRKQREVVEGLERLINILLERKSVENLDEQQRAAARQAADARQLAQRQRDLQQRTNQTLRGDPNPAETALQQQLQELQQREREQAERNAREAGTRRPFLESSLQRIEALLQQQQELETAVAAGEQLAAAQQRRQFDLGNLSQRARELAAQVQAQARQSELAEAATALQQATADTDAQRLQQARDRLEAMLQDPPKLRGGVEGPAADRRWQELREQLQQAPAGNSPAAREALAKAAADSMEHAQSRANTAAEQNAADANRLRQETSRTADAMRNQERAAATAAELEQAKQALEQAATAAAAAETSSAAAELDRAMAALERARSNDRNANPDPARQSAQMAAEATAAAEELRNAPAAADAEQAASGDLRNAAQALRRAEDQLQAAAAAGRRAEPQSELQQSRQQLEQARARLQQALNEATSGRQEDLQAAAAAQQQLEAGAAAAQQAVQQARQQGQLSPEQAQAAADQLQAAAEAMQQARQQLERGQQANAANRQQAAADALQRASDGLQQQRPQSAAQRDELRAQADEEGQLAEDIAQLARELAERDNERAQRAAEQAQQAAQRAQQAMLDGDEQQTRQQQEEARQRLEEAARQLEQERDRYQDLRQEELLFKMKEELVAFLERQRPLTLQTLELQQQIGSEAPSRPARRQLNQISEEEQQLAGRVDFLIQALAEEGNLVYQAVLRANLDDLREIVRRLAGRSPDAGRFTTLLQQDVERRSEDLLAALEQERQRREQERREREQQEESPKGENRFNPQREKLVSLIAELEMLKRLELDTSRAAKEQWTLIDARSDERISEAEVALVERLSHRHAEITQLFLQIKAGIEEAMAAMSGNQDESAGGSNPGGGGRGGR